MNPANAGADGASQFPSRVSARVQWIDVAKGWCIVMVVTMHSTLGVGVDLDSSSWLHAFVAFAKPFRMPDFFLVAGLMASRAISGSWRRFVDRKIVHFVYFYALWLAIVLAAKSGHLGIATPSRFLGEYLWRMVEPFSTLWFIQLLPFFFLTVRLLERVDRISVLFAAAALHILAASHSAGGAYAMDSIWTGWTTVDSFALFFVFFYVGHIAREPVFQLASAAARRPWRYQTVVSVWAVAETIGVHAGATEIPGVTLIAGFAGALAVVVCASWLARSAIGRPLAYCGRNSLVIYLTFVLPMAAARAFLIRTDVVHDVGAIASIVTLIAIAAPLALRAVVAGSPLAFLYVRPHWARLEGEGVAHAARVAVAR